MVKIFLSLKTPAIVKASMERKVWPSDQKILLMKLTFKHIKEADYVERKVEPNASFERVDGNFSMEVIFINGLDIRGEIQPSFILKSQYKGKSILL